MPELPTCPCVEGMPPYDRLTAIYQAAAELSGDSSLPDSLCVAGVAPLQRLAYIYAAFRVLANDNTLPSMECVEGESFPDQVTRIYQAAFAYAADSDLPAVDCVRGTPIWQQWVNIYAALYSVAGEPDDLVSPLCVSPQFDVLSRVFCALSVLNATPEVIAAEIGETFDTITITFNQNVVGQNGFTVNVNGAPINIAYISGEGTSTYSYQLDTTISQGDVVTLDYIPGNIVNESAVPMEAFVDFPVENPLNVFTYLRPGGVFTYHRPDGTSIYVRP